MDSIIDKIKTQNSEPLMRGIVLGRRKIGWRPFHALLLSLVFLIAIVGLIFYQLYIRRDIGKYVIDNELPLEGRTR